MADPRHAEVRVIAGTLKGRMLRYPWGKALRPTMQRTKASVFDSLSSSVAGCVFLDLYAGAGGVGIEALSRGAARVHFVENDAEAVRHLRDNLARCGIGADRGVVHAGTVGAFLHGGALREIAPDIIYADPPYDADEMRVLLEFFDGIEYALDALLVVEHRKDTTSLERFEKLVVVDVRRFGQSYVSYIALGGQGR
jgi:16S rRNA (guanine966-N2)-methyltransferase